MLFYISCVGTLDFLILNAAQNTHSLYTFPNLNRWANIFFCMFVKIPKVLLLTPADWQWFEFRSWQGNNYVNHMNFSNKVENSHIMYPTSCSISAKWLSFGEWRNSNTVQTTMLDYSLALQSRWARVWPRLLFLLRTHLHVIWAYEIHAWEQCEFKLN